MTTPPRWATLIPDLTVRQQWIDEFGPDGALAAAALVRHFTEPATAREWSNTPFPVEQCAYLHRHGVPATEALLDQAVTSAADESHIFSMTEVLHRACLLLAHPHLTREDRDTILSAGVTLDELDHLITADTYDRAILTTMGALR